MSETPGQANLQMACAFVDELAARGVKHAVISPGSRSTPLALALAKHPDFSIRILIDERSAAFFALGMARHLGAPVASLCTSGTAAANFAPAVIEASLSRLPLIILTADRPPELRDWGASQTIDQIRLFGSHAKWFADMPVPENIAALHRHARGTAARAVQTARMVPAGPVHLNMPFREPLLPDQMPTAAQFLELFDAGRSGVHTASEVGTLLPSDTGLNELASSIARTPRGIIICGPGAEPGLAAAVTNLAKVSGYPVLADPLSSLRFGPHDRSHILNAYDLFLRDPRIAGALAPDLVVRIGAQPTSKPLQQFLATNPGQQHWLIDPGSPRDPFHLATRHLATNATDTLGRLPDLLRDFKSRKDQQWHRHWIDLDASSRTALSKAMSEIDGFFEGRIVAEVADLLPSGATFVLGNSMPVRDVDTFVPGCDRDVRLVGTRGASGIDGVVSTALGAASVTSGPVVAVVGDLSFFHDLNGLHTGRLLDTSCTIVVINNNGGGIFSFLPQAELLDATTFETLFGTPTDLCIEGAAALFKASYARPACWQSFRDTLRHAMAAKGLSIVEVVTDRQENFRQHRKVAAQVLSSLRSRLDPGANHA